MIANLMFKKRMGRNLGIIRKNVRIVDSNGRDYIVDMMATKTHVLGVG